MPNGSVNDMDQVRMPPALSSQTTRADLIARLDDGAGRSVCGRSTKIMSNQVYYIHARVGANSIGLYVESPDFNSAYDVAEERIAQSYKGPFIVQALQLIRDRNTEGQC